MKPLIAITMGDPAGVGPEVIAMALAGPELYGLCRPLVVGDLVVMERAAALTKAPVTVRAVAEPGLAGCTPGTIDVLDLANVPPDVPVARVDARAGKAAYEYVAKAVELAMAGSVAAMATAPINKEALSLAGCPYPGHTEILAALSHTKDYAMMLVSGALRVIHVTTHVSMRKACDLIRKDRVLRVIRLAHDALQAMGLAAPRIAVAGLNPHAGEAGLFGDEEILEIIPAIEAAQDLGLDVTGPVPPDTVFFRTIRRKEFDIVVVMYHDQGHIPIKVLGFDSGVNVTVGLPFIRTSVDHGTAFDKAGTATADCSSMKEAVRLAAQMAETATGGVNGPTQGEETCR